MISLLVDFNDFTMFLQHSKEYLFILLLGLCRDLVTAVLWQLKQVVLMSFCLRLRKTMVFSLIQLGTSVFHLKQQIPL